MSRPTLTADHFTATGLSPILLRFPTHSPYVTARPGPRSLAATDGVSIDVLSSGYLDVSVPRVRSFNPMYSGRKYLVHSPNDRQKQSIVECQVGSPIRKFRDQRVLSPPPDLSQSATSFIASCRQGIHQTPFSRLIRSRRRTTPFCAGAGSGPQRRSRSSVGSRLCSRSSATAEARAKNHDQCVRLGKTVFIDGRRRTGGRPPDRSGRHAASLTRERHEDVSCFSLFTMSNLRGETPRKRSKRIATRCPTPGKIRRRSLVEPVGFEPTTPCLQSRCSPS